MAGMLTTVDNPWSPFTQYAEWDAFDRGKGYFSSSLLDRVVGSRSTFTEEEDIDDGIDTILAIPPSGVYERVLEKDYTQGAERRKRFNQGAPRQNLAPA